MKNKKIDRYRLLAVATIFFGVLYFYANLFIPKIIPRTFRIGTIRIPATILILGTDVNFDVNTGEPIEKSNSRTDSILLLRADPVHYKMNVLSIPRDSFVPIPGHGVNKINAANVFGGIELAKTTVANLAGKNIDYFIEINPYGIVKLVDLLGGVKLFVEKDMYYIDHAQNLHINLKKGHHRLSGKEAQDYIRFRHDATGDIGRMERQQKFLQALFLSLARPANIMKAPLIIDIANKYIKTDLPLLKIIRLSNFVRMLSLRDIRTFTPSAESGTSDYAGSILLLNKYELEKILNAYF